MADASYQPAVYRKQGGNEIVIASGGTLTAESGATVTSAVNVTAPSFTLSSPRWDDLQVSVYATKLGGLSDPDWVKLRDDGSGSTGVFTWHFDKTTSEELFFSVQLPHAWDAGSAIKPHVHWCPVDTDTGTVCWGLEYWLSKRTGTPNANSTIIKSTPTAASGTAYLEQIEGVGTITTTGYPVSTVLVCRLFRDVATDDYNNDAALLGFDFHYQTDTPGGSDAEYTKS